LQQLLVRRVGEICREVNQVRVARAIALWALRYRTDEGVLQTWFLNAAVHVKLKNNHGLFSLITPVTTYKLGTLQPTPGNRGLPSHSLPMTPK
jgi:hypothetical protein